MVESGVTRDVARTYREALCVSPLTALISSTLGPEPLGIYGARVAWPDTAGEEYREELR